MLSDGMCSLRSAFRRPDFGFLLTGSFVRGWFPEAALCLIFA